jgi:hypothetical protein
MKACAKCGAAHEKCADDRPEIPSTAHRPAHPDHGLRNQAAAAAQRPTHAVVEPAQIRLQLDAQSATRDARACGHTDTQTLIDKRHEHAAAIMLTG